MAVVCFTEPDDEIRTAYFDCEKHAHGPWLVPSGSDLGRAAGRIGYQRYKIPTCPRRFIWASTLHNFRSMTVRAALRYPKMRLVAGGVLQQPASVGQIVEIVRGEIRAFRELRSAAKQK